MTAPAAPGTLSVSLLHDYREDGHVSMKLYAEHLGAALERIGGVAVTRVRPRDVLPPALRRGRLLDKLDSYVGRFVVYPRIARRLRADVFHIVDHGQAYLVPSLDPGRTVVTCHDVILLAVAAGRLRAEFRPPLATRILRLSIERMKRARRIIADSEHTRRDLADLAGVDPGGVEVIYPGLNQTFRPAPGRRAEIRARLRLPPGPLVLHVGQTGFYKNIPGCLQVVALLRRRGIGVSFVRGGRPMTAEQRALAGRLGISEACLELGPVPPSTLADLYLASDVLLFPSLYEGFGWPPVEAMASGLPVVCSRAGSLGEVVGDAALTAAPEEWEALADHVASVLSNPAIAARLGALGLARASCFDWEKAAERVRAVYRSALES